MARPTSLEDAVPKDLLTATWKLLLLRGLVAIVLGIVLIAWPESTIRPIAAM